MADSRNQELAGLICAYELDQSGGGRPLVWEDIRIPSADGKPRWIHLNFEDPNARTWLRDSSGLDSNIADALLDDDSRPRAVQHDNGLLVILRGVNLNEGAKPDDMVSIRVWLEESRIISTRRRKLQSVSILRSKLSEGLGPKGPVDFLLKLITQLGERIEPMIDNLDDAIEQAELRFENDGVSGYRGELSALRRQSARIRRFLAPQREGLERLSKDATSLLSDSNRFLLREEADQITRYLETLDLVRERAMVAQEEILAKLALEQNNRMYILAIVAAIFLPLSFVTGMLGMNVAGLPGQGDENAFAITVALMLLTGGMIIAIFKLKKWM